jgi:hypothetical protein
MVDSHVKLSPNKVFQHLHRPKFLANPRDPDILKQKRKNVNSTALQHSLFKRYAFHSHN